MHFLHHWLVLESVFVHPVCWLCCQLVMLQHCSYLFFFLLFFVVAFAFAEDFGETDLKPAGDAFLVLFDGEVMDLVAGDFAFCFFVVGGVELLIITCYFCDDCCCYRQKKKQLSHIEKINEVNVYNNADFFKDMYLLGYTCSDGIY